MIWRQQHRNATAGLYASDLRYAQRARLTAGLIVAPSVSRVSAARANMGQAAVAGPGHAAATSSRPKGR